MEVSLEEYVMGVAILVPDALCAEAVKLRVAPSVKVALFVGVRVMCPGKIGGPGLVPPPHPAMPKEVRIATAKRRPRERNRPMHPLL
jgi:hypothetical protein